MESSNLSTEILAEMPHMEESGFAMWLEKVRISKCYLEYGAGKSTTFAANKIKARKIISVDSDLNWLSKVLASAVEQSQSGSLALLYAKIGEVGDWGFPLNRDGCQTFHEYITLPWRYASQEDLKPDVVLIDGRFRVACFLYSLISSELGTVILFDDYLDRPEYHIVQRYCNIAASAGRMAMFINRREFQTDILVQDLLAYSQNWD